MKLPKLSLLAEELVAIAAALEQAPVSDKATQLGRIEDLNERVLAIHQQLSVHEDALYANEDGGDSDLADISGDEGGVRATIEFFTDSALSLDDIQVSLCGALAAVHLDDHISTLSIDQIP